ncbi:hypothetical protein KCU92_g6194, partial [Aureobasidium melanogenum]
MAIAIATRLSPKAMTTLGVMAFVTLCFQTFNSSALPSADAATLDRLDVIERQMATLRATMNHVLKETDTEAPANITWPDKPSSDEGLEAAVKFFFGIAAIMAWGASVSIFFNEAGAKAERTFAIGIWAACATFVALWYLGQPREWYDYFLGATWGFTVALFLSAVFDGRDEVVVDGQKA